MVQLDEAGYVRVQKAHRQLRCLLTFHQHQHSSPDVSLSSVLFDVLDKIPQHHPEAPLVGRAQHFAHWAILLALGVQFNEWKVAIKVKTHHLTSNGLERTLLKEGLLSTPSRALLFDLLVWTRAMLCLSVSFEAYISSISCT